jgi:hypothetical protein
LDVTCWRRPASADLRQHGIVIEDRRRGARDTPVKVVEALSRMTLRPGLVLMRKNQVAAILPRWPPTRPRPTSCSVNNAAGPDAYAAAWAGSACCSSSGAGGGARHVVSPA